MLQQVLSVYRKENTDRSSKHLRQKEVPGEVREQEVELPLAVEPQVEEQITHEEEIQPAVEGQLREEEIQPAEAPGAEQLEERPPIQAFLLPHLRFPLLLRLHKEEVERVQEEEEGRMCLE